MLSLSLLAWLTLFAAIFALWWQSDKVKSRALILVQNHCRQLNLQLLDQTMVLRGLWPQRSAAGNLQLRRRYDFEFTSTGATRHKGYLVLLGITVLSMELEAHVLPDQDRSLH